MTDNAYELKLERLAEQEGFPSVEALLEENAVDSVVPGICMTEGCDYSTGVEPDSRAGWCEECAAGTMKSCLVLAGVI